MHFPHRSVPHPTPSARRLPLDRRTFLAGAVAAGLAACSSGNDDDSTPEDATIDDGDSPGFDGADLDVAEEFSGPSSELDTGTFTLAQRFPSAALVPGEVRLPHSLFRDADFVNDGPATLGAQVVDIDGAPIGERLVAQRFDISPAAYYVWRPTIDAPGIYSLVVDGGPAEGASFQVFERDQVSVPLVGDVLAGFDTPTADAPGGVDPICTRDPICPFHSVTLTDALADDRGVAYIIGTPAFCQTGTCAPALEVMIGLESEFSDDFVFVHAEVFTDLTATETTPAIEAAGLSYEPALFITDGTGTIVERLDAIWGADELRERLTLARA